MPRKSQTKEKFTTLSIEESTAEIIYKHKYPEEPLYITFRRMTSIYDRDTELKALHFMIHEYEQTMIRQKNEIDQLKKERNNYILWSRQYNT